MTTLGTMIDRISDELARSDLTTQIGDAVRSAINFYGSQRWWFTETNALTLTLTSSVEFYNLPADFEILDDISLIQPPAGSPPVYVDLDERHFSIIDGWQSGSGFGQPTDYCIYGSQVRFFPIPNQSTNAVLTYVATAPTLTSTSCTSPFMTYGEELIRNRARVDIQINFLRDEGATAEYLALMQSGLPFYSHRERTAFQALRRRNAARLVTGRTKPSGW